MKNKIEVCLKDQNKRSLVLILPGGGYAYTSKREGMPVAKMLNDLGYHAAIYHYRETMLKSDDLFNEGVSLINELKLLNIDKLYLMGFSAGGHLAGFLATIIQIDGLILCYPVVSTKKDLIHQASFDNLLKVNDNLEDFSLEKRITKQMMPTFLWHTKEDKSVKVGNTLALYQALIKYDTSVDLHIFNEGKHGLSIITKETAFNDNVADYLKENQRVAIWTTLLKGWLENND